MDLQSEYVRRYGRMWASYTRYIHMIDSLFPFTSKWFILYMLCIVKNNLTMSERAHYSVLYGQVIWVDVCWPNISINSHGKAKASYQSTRYHLCWSNLIQLRATVNIIPLRTWEPAGGFVLRLSKQTMYNIISLADSLGTRRCRMMTFTMRMRMWFYHVDVEPYS